MDSAAWGLLGTAVGALASIATTLLTTRSASERELAKLREDRSERARAFQRQTLLDLQDALHDAFRLVARAHLEDEKAAHEGKPWGKNKLSDEVNEGLLVSQRRVAILVERVADDDLRSKLKSLAQTTGHVTLARSRDESEFGMSKGTGELTNVLEAIGTVLRQHY